VASILCVDDEADILEIIQFDLEFQGHTVTISGSVDDALAKLAVKDFDLVISDVKMPCRDGKDLAKAIRSKGNSIPIVFVSGYAELDEAFLKQHQIETVISKPYSLDKLNSSIEKILQK
jgi:CheY-like chemotaxis protein